MDIDLMLSPQPLDFSQIFSLIMEIFPEGKIEKEEWPHQFSLIVPVELLERVMRVLRDDERFAFNSLMCLSGVDRQGLEVVYHLYSMIHNHKVSVKVKVPYEEPRVPSVCHLWRTAEWHEREAYDMFGIEFVGHPDLRRILCPEDWEGHPLRKNYQPPLWYRGIPVTVNVPGGATTPSSRTES